LTSPTLPEQQGVGAHMPEIVERLDNRHSCLLAGPEHAGAEFRKRVVHVDNVRLKLRNLLTQTLVGSPGPEKAWHRQHLPECSAIFQLGRGGFELIHDVAPVAEQLGLKLHDGILASPARGIVVVHLKNAQFSVAFRHEAYAVAATFDRIVVSADCRESGERATRHWAAMSRFPQSVYRLSCKFGLAESDCGTAFLPGRPVIPRCRLAS